VAEDEVLFEVSTDKVDSEVPSPVAGVLTEILVPEGETVEVGKAIASPDIVARIRELGSDPGTASEKDVRAFLDAETKKWAEVIRVSGAKAD